MEGYEFYQQPELATGLCRSVFSDLPGLPDFRLRAINRMFLKNFINKCPVEFLEPVLLPVLIQVKLVPWKQHLNIWQSVGSPISPDVGPIVVVKEPF